jgi:hypothetical protein
MPRTQVELVVEQGAHEDPEQDGVADRDRDERCLPPRRPVPLDRRHGADGLHAQAETEPEAGTRRIVARPLAAQGKREQRERRDQRAAQRGVDEGQGVRWHCRDHCPPA